MAASFHLRVTLPDRLVFEGEVSSIIVPAHNGYLGVLAHHAPIIAKLVPGRITLSDASGLTRTFDSNGNGFLEVSKNRASIMLDSLEPQP